MLYNVPRQLKTPPQYLEINAIKHLRYLLDVKIPNNKISSRNELKGILSDARIKIGTEII